MFFQPVIATRAHILFIYILLHRKHRVTRRGRFLFLFRRAYQSKSHGNLAIIITRRCKTIRNSPFIWWYLIWSHKLSARGLPIYSPTNCTYYIISIGTTVTTRIIMHEKLRGTRCTAGTYTCYMYNIHTYNIHIYIYIYEVVLIIG